MRSEVTRDSITRCVNTATVSSEMGTTQTFDLLGEKKTIVIYPSIERGIYMRKVVLALAFASFGVTCASAEIVRTKHDHSTADFGVGGWTMGSGVGGWRQNSDTKALSNASAGGVSSSATTEISSAAAGAVSSSAANLPGSRPLPVQVLRNDSDCVFVAQQTPTGNLWRPGCK